MLQGEPSELREIASALGIELHDLERFLPALNALGKALFTARVHEEDVWSRAMSTSRLCASGLTHADFRDFLDRGLIMADGRHGASRRVVLSDPGLVVLQAAIPLGAIRPNYDRASQELTVAGHMIRQPAVQGHNLSTVLSSLEGAAWARRVEKPLTGRHCAGDPHSLQVALSTLSRQQRLIEFHARGGAVTWNWRPERNIKHR